MTRIHTYVTTFIFTLLTTAMLFPATAQAHRFNVALVAPSSGWNSTVGETIFKRFMVATTERDNHADEESDGHLGGLDVYVTLADQNKKVISNIGRGLPWEEIDIIVRFSGAGDNTNKATMSVPASTPDAGYKAAQIIGKAVRAQGGVDAVLALQREFDQFR